MRFVSVQILKNLRPGIILVHSAGTDWVGHRARCWADTKRYEQLPASQRASLALSRGSREKEGIISMRVFWILFNYLSHCLQEHMLCCVNCHICTFDSEMCSPQLWAQKALRGALVGGAVWGSLWKPSQRMWLMSSMSKDKKTSLSEGERGGSRRRAACAEPAWSSRSPWG